MSESPTRCAWETDASQHTPSKRQRREAAAATPATPAAPPSLRQRGVSLARVAADVGSLAAATSRHPRFASAELYGPLLGAADAGARRAVARASPRRQRRGRRPRPRLCVDVEMCERRSDGARFPLAVCAVALTWEAAAGGVARRADRRRGPRRPGLREALGWRSPDYGDRLAWKGEVHGLAWADHVAAPALLGLGDVQRALRGRVGQESEIPNFKGSYLGPSPVDAAPRRAAAGDAAPAARAARAAAAKMRASQLQAELKAMGVSTLGMLEKTELVAAYAQAKAMGDPARATIQQAAQNPKVMAAVQDVMANGPAP
ncbi:hypothetical protein SO694_00022338 [Aureococcus anophagefferens]|uniref:Uncharacterized protein n=1 Tax=Aureococcus anophagefferens TaxID=44056 RepID=A0ABR1FTA9_AURAN